MDRLLVSEDNDDLGSSARNQVRRERRGDKRGGEGGEVVISLTSERSAPICKPNPTPPVAMQLGADHVPSSSRAITIPLPNFPDQTKPALRIVKIAKLSVGHVSELGLRSRGSGGRVGSPFRFAEDCLWDGVEGRRRIVGIGEEGLQDFG